MITKLFSELQEEINVEEIDTQEGRRQIKHRVLATLRAARSAYIAGEIQERQEDNAEIDHWDRVVKFLDQLDDHDKELNATLPNLTTAAKLVKEDEALANPREWLIPDLIPKGCLSMLTGAGGIGKTYLALQIAAASAMGVPEKFVSSEHVHEITTVTAKVIYATYELNPRDLAYRLAGISNHFPWCQYKQLRDFITPLYMPQYAGAGAIWAVPTGEHRARRASLLPAGDALLEQINSKETHADLLIIDPLGLAYLDDEMNRAAVSEFLVTLQEWCEYHDKTILLLAHPPKYQSKASSDDEDDGTAGSSAWRAGVRSILWLRKKIKPNATDKAPEECYHALIHSKNNFGLPHAEILLTKEQGCWTQTDDIDKAVESYAKLHTSYATENDADAARNRELV